MALKLLQYAILLTFSRKYLPPHNAATLKTAPLAIKVLVQEMIELGYNA